MQSALTRDGLGVVPQERRDIVVPTLASRLWRDYLGTQSPGRYPFLPREEGARVKGSVQSAQEPGAQQGAGQTWHTDGSVVGTPGLACVPMACGFLVCEVTWASPGLGLHPGAKRVQDFGKLQNSLAVARLQDPLRWSAVGEGHSPASKRTQGDDMFRLWQESSLPH